MARKPVRPGRYPIAFSDLVPVNVVQDYAPFRRTRGELTNGQSGSPALRSALRRASTSTCRKPNILGHTLVIDTPGRIVSTY